MTIQKEYVLQTISPVSDVQTFSAIPARVDLPNGDVLFGATEEWSNDEYAFVVREIDVPDPEPSPAPVEPTPLEKLASIGLTPADLKTLLGL